MQKIWGREPAVFFALLASVVLAAIQLVGVTEPVSGALNAFVVAGAGLATAAMVDAERVLPALTGLAQAVFALFLAYGSPLPESTQTGILALIAAVGAFFVRQQVIAPVNPARAELLADTAARHSAYQEAYQEGYERGRHADGPDFEGTVR
jgi:hypothetical protein